MLAALPAAIFGASEVSNGSNSLKRLSYPLAGHNSALNAPTLRQEA